MNRVYCEGFVFDCMSVNIVDGWAVCKNVIDDKLLVRTLERKYVYYILTDGETRVREHLVKRISDVEYPLITKEQAQADYNTYKKDAEIKRLKNRSFWDVLFRKGI